MTDSFIHWVIESSFHLNLQDIINPKPLELGTWTFGSMFTLHHVSHITCQVSGVRCQFSRVTCQMSHVIYFFFFNFFLLRTIWWSFLVEGLLSTGPTLSSLQATMVWNAINERSFLLLLMLLSALVEIFGVSCMRDFFLLHRVAKQVFTVFSDSVYKLQSPSIVLFVPSLGTWNQMDWRILVKDRIDKLQNQETLFFNAFKAWLGQFLE